MSNSRHATNKTQTVLILGHGLTQEINDATIYTVDNKTFCLSLHYSNDNSYLLVNGRDVTKFKAKNSELIKYPMCIRIKVVVKTQDYMEMFMTLVLIIVLLQMIKY